MPTYELQSSYRAPTSRLQIACRQAFQIVGKQSYHRQHRRRNHHELHPNRKKLAMSTRPRFRPRFAECPRLRPRRCWPASQWRYCLARPPGGQCSLERLGGRLGNVLELELEPGGPADQRYCPQVVQPIQPIQPTGGPPAAGDTAQIANGGTANVTTSGPVCGTLSLGTAAGSGTLQVRRQPGDQQFRLCRQQRRGHTRAVGRSRVRG